MGRLLKERESQKTFLFTLVGMNDECCSDSFAGREDERWRDAKSLQIPFRESGGFFCLQDLAATKEE
jgi:hypothetical protein